MPSTSDDTWPRDWQPPPPAYPAPRDETARAGAFESFLVGALLGVMLWLAGGFALWMIFFR